MTTPFGPQQLTDTLGEVRRWRRQLRLAETENTPMTFFLNGGEESQAEGEEQDPLAEGCHYDMKLEMSADGVFAALESIENRSHDLIVMNFANPDMVGHTGNLEAAIRAVETVDSAVGQIADAVLAAGSMIVTADHGNCEMMWTMTPHLRTRRDNQSCPSSLSVHLRARSFMTAVSPIWHQACLR